MSDNPHAPLGDVKDASKEHEKIASIGRESSSDDVSENEGVDILASQAIDPVLSAKMHIVNNVSESPEDATCDD